MNCEKTSALCPSSTTSIRRGISTSNFADGAIRAPLVDEADVAGRLPQTQQCLEHVDLGLAETVPRHPLQQRRAVERPQLVVRGALRLIELAVDRLFGARRQLGRDLRLRCAAGSAA